MRLTIWILLLLLSLLSVGFAQGKRRVIRVRKTGEYGKRIVPLSQLYEPPKRTNNLDPYLEGSESRRTSIQEIKRPSQTLELPFFGVSEHELDSLPAESGDIPHEHVLPSPEEIPNYDNMLDKHPPVAGHPASHHEEEQQGLGMEEQRDDPNVKLPEDEGASNFFRSETQVNIDAEEQRLIPASQPSPVSDRASAELRQTEHRSNSDGIQHNSPCNESDQGCGSESYAGLIPGEAGTDYPILREIVDTSFSCDNVEHSGYYADTDERSRCQIFHVCLKGNEHRRTQKWSMLCPNGTVFSQSDFVCVWWYDAPECNPSSIQELSMKNSELGWDDMTATNERSSGGNSDLLSEAGSRQSENLQASGSSRKGRPFTSTTTGQPQQQSRASTLPYRIPVKENARTRLKEISGNGIQDGGTSEGEYRGEETESFETSLRHQSEARSRSKSKSALAFKKSESEAYELKSVPDSVSPFLVNGQQDGEEVMQTTDNGDTPQLVLMSAQQRSPDGSESYAQVPVMMGYRYPVPTSSGPGEEYLPPKHEFRPEPLKSTTDNPTTTTFLPLPIKEDTGVTDGGPQYYQTTEEIIDTTTGQDGYIYSSPLLSTTEQTQDYTYSSPAVSSYTEFPEKLEDTSTQGYNYETSTVRADTTTATVPTTTRVQSSVTPSAILSSTTSSTTGNSELPDAYLPPKNDGGYNIPSASLRAGEADVLDLPTTSRPDETSSVRATQREEIINRPDRNSQRDETSAGGKPSTTVSIPTPPSRSDEASGDNNLDNDEKVSRILQEIRNGGAEVRDENGNPLGYEELRKIILSTPSGLLSLQKADDAHSASGSGSVSGESEVPPYTTPEGQEGEEQEVETETALPVDTSSKLAEVQGEIVSETPSPPDSALQYIPQPPSQNYQAAQFQVETPQPNSSPNEQQLLLNGGFQPHDVQRNSLEQINSDNSQFHNFQSQSNYDRDGKGNQYYSQNLEPTPTPYLFPSTTQVHTAFRTSQPGPEKVTYLQSSTHPQSQPTQYYGPEELGNQNNYISNESPASSFLSTQQPQNQYFHQPTPQYLPSSSSQEYSTSNQQETRSSPTQFRSSNIPPTRTRDLTNDIQLQQSYSFPVNQLASAASTINSVKRLANPNPLNIKIVPALLVNQHTKVEFPNPDPYAAASVAVPVSVRAPRLTSFTYDDALPMPRQEKFRAEEGRNFVRMKRQDRALVSAHSNGSRSHLRQDRLVDRFVNGKLLGQGLRSERLG